MNKIVTFKWNQLENQQFPSGNIHTTKTVYDAYYVNRHYDCLTRIAENDFEYICVTDNPKGLSSEITIVPLWNKCRDLGGCYNRMYIFSKDMKELIGDKFVTVDLDTTFLTDFSWMFEPEETTIHFGKVYHPGISLIIAGEWTEIWDSFIKENIQNNIEKSRVEFNGTDQAWFNYYLKYNNKKINKWTQEDGIFLVVSLQSHLKYNKLPEQWRLLSWAGPRDPYQNQYVNLPWLNKYL